MERAIVKSAKSISSTKLGFCLIILSAAFAALLHVLGKPLLGSSELEGYVINPVALAATIFIINGLFFTSISKDSESIKKIGSRNLILMTLIGITEVSAVMAMFFGLKESTAINASIFSNGEIIFSLIIAISIFRERLQRKELTPFVMIIFGMLVLPVSYDLYLNGLSLSGLVFGDLLIILAGVLYAVDINICKYVSDRFSSKRITQISSFAAGGFALAVLIAFQIPYDIDIMQMPSIAIIAILGTGVSTLFFLIALRLIGAMRTILIYSTTSVFGVIFSAIILSEQVTMVNVISIVTVIVGLYILRNKLGIIESNESPDKKTDSSYLEKSTELTTNLLTNVQGKYFVVSMPGYHTTKIHTKKIDKFNQAKYLIKKFTSLFEGG